MQSKIWTLETMKYSLAAWLLCSALICAETAVAQEDPKDIVPPAVRIAGYKCDNPVSVKPDPEHSAPDQKAWIIRCESGTYQVKFMGDTGATVKPISVR